MDKSPTSPSFPGQYHQPRRRDAHIASAAPDSQFLEFFRQSLIYSPKYCTDPTCCSCFDVAGDQLPNSSQETSLALVSDIDLDSETSEVLGDDDDGVEWPLSLFAKLGDLPPPEVLDALLNDFQTRFVPFMPFLSALSPSTLVQRNALPYVIITMALLGSVVSQEPEHKQWSDHLWVAGVNLLRGTVEVDNSLGRAMDWRKAAIFLVTFGTMQADMEIWRETNNIAGYLQAARHGQGFLTETPSVAGSQEGNNEQRQEAAAMMNFYFLVDTLRAVHFGVASTFSVDWLIQNSSKATDDFRDVYRAFVHKDRPLPTTMSSDDHLLILVAILSDIHSLLLSLGPLIMPDLQDCQAQCGDARGDDAFISPELLALPKQVFSSQDCNPFLPFTARSQYDHMKKVLYRAIEAWRASIRAQNSEVDDGVSDNNQMLLPLMHFCHLLLEAGPGIYVTSELAQYPSGAPINAGNDSPSKLGVRFSDATMNAAMEILEVIGRTSLQMELNVNGTARRTAPISYPLVTYFAGLVVRARVLEGEEGTNLPKGAFKNISAPRKLLDIFRVELRKMESTWACASHMSKAVGQ